MVQPRTKRTLQGSFLLCLALAAVVALMGLNFVVHTHQPLCSDAHSLVAGAVVARRRSDTDPQDDTVETDKKARTATGAPAGAVAVGASEWDRDRDRGRGRDRDRDRDIPAALSSQRTGRSSRTETLNYTENHTKNHAENHAQAARFYYQQWRAVAAELKRAVVRYGRLCRPCSTTC